MGIRGFEPLNCLHRIDLKSIAFARLAKFPQLKSYPCYCLAKRHYSKFFIKIAH